MAGVQIPTIKRLDVPEPASEGRIQTGVPDAQKAFAPAAQGLSNLVEATIKYERDAADTEGLKAGLEYATWYNKRLDGDSESGELGLKHLKGDPTEAFNKFDQEAEQKYNEIVSKYDGSSDFTKRSVEKNLLSKHSSLFAERLTSYGYQYSIHEKEVTDAATRMEVDGAAKAVAFYDGKNDSTLAPFESNIGNIRDIRIKEGLKNGMVQAAEDGEYVFFDGDQQLNVNIDPRTKTLIKKDISTATFGAIENLVQSSQYEKAQAMFSRYGGQLDEVHKLKLKEQIDNLEVEVRAFDVLDRASDKSFKEQKKIIGAMPSKTLPEKKAKQKAYELIDARERQQSNLQSRDSEEVYNTLAIMAQKGIEEKKYDSIYQFESEPEYKKLIDRVTDPKQRKALTELFEHPKESDQEALANVYETARTEGLYGVSFPDLQERMIGLNESDKQRVISIWKKDNVETASEDRAQSRWFRNLLFSEAEGLGLIKRINGKMTDKSLKWANAFESRIVEQVDRLPKNTSETEARKYFNKLLAEEVVRLQKGRRGFSNLFGLIGSGESVSDEVAAPERVAGQRRGYTRKEEENSSVQKPAKDYSSLSTSEKAQVIEDFKKATGKKRASSAKELKDWYDSKGKK